MQTERQHIIDLLSEREMDARELSRILGIQEKEIYRHLTHIQKSVASQGKKLIIKPFQCLSCGYTFKNRKRFTPPGRCPKCKSTYLEKPSFKIYP
ncbi:MAG TPA: ArsR family transcriptional regulator [Deltaproteobacteria bacterium]|nr:MAG: transcriptional regulator [Deltaproteobacteria bacterium]RLB09717.1 MAG: transcriptional regulator [Deltaproteobacteria bacterium]HDM79444.1 ArsR family transcriptional regulator [Deltaproteobacteria bacterium]HEC31763.1 ArsR family transcriptional regulator [Deltaproteobacteria bacterium]